MDGGQWTEDREQNAEDREQNAENGKQNRKLQTELKIANGIGIGNRGSEIAKIKIIKITVIAEFLFRASEIKISATSRASGVRAPARQFKNRLSAEIADSGAAASAMTVIKQQLFPVFCFPSSVHCLLPAHLPQIQTKPRRAFPASGDGVSSSAGGESVVAVKGEDDSVVVFVSAEFAQVHFRVPSGGGGLPDAFGEFVEHRKAGGTFVEKFFRFRNRVVDAPGNFGEFAKRFGFRIVGREFRKRRGVATGDGLAGDTPEVGTGVGRAGVAFRDERREESGVSEVNFGVGDSGGAEGSGGDAGDFQIALRRVGAEEFGAELQNFARAPGQVGAGSQGGSAIRPPSDSGLAGRRVVSRDLRGVVGANAEGASGQRVGHLECPRVQVAAADGEGFPVFGERRDDESVLVVGEKVQRASPRPLHRGGANRRQIRQSLGGVHFFFGKGSGEKRVGAERERGFRDYNTLPRGNGLHRGWVA